MTIGNEVIEDLVARYKEDETVLPEILACYKPLFISLRAKFKNVKYTNDEWDQEMRLITHECLRKYKPGYQRTFGLFLKTAIVFRCQDEWRRQNAKKRQAEKNAVSLSINGAHLVGCDSINEATPLNITDVRCKMADFIGNLSIEERAFFAEFVLGDIDGDEETQIQKKSKK